MSMSTKKLSPELNEIKISQTSFVQKCMNTTFGKMNGVKTVIFFCGITTTQAIVSVTAVLIEAGQQADLENRRL